MGFEENKHILIQIRGLGGVIMLGVFDLRVWCFEVEIINIFLFSASKSCSFFDWRQSDQTVPDVLCPYSRRSMWWGTISAGRDRKLQQVSGQFCRIYVGVGVVVHCCKDREFALDHVCEEVIVGHEVMLSVVVTSSFVLL